MNIFCHPKVDRPEVLQIIIDGEFWREISVSVFGKRPKFPKQATQQEFSSFFSKYEYQKAREYGLRRLGAKSYLSKDLSDLMKKKGISAPVIQKIMEEFSKNGYLDDERWIQNYILSCISRKYGKKAIVLKLQQKGLIREDAERVISQYLPEGQQKESLFKLLETKYKNRNLYDPKEKQKVLVSLARKGFEFDLILEAIEICLKNIKN